ncbi:hypothetical protein BU23DRAFT_213124 [Bimuria novae-zelandiae CBS 107.79]|uniref:Uncharacterized protein n=1 Tax=Bimuria novae-zelandiae CBS 107.79 TaxID=1447943 RepID=A0A6A5V1A8_9PLEO|nr:hypothetical protein BU23DRAFT_213124 [Bimuria novae-zelandiae CBS 107.79]
MTTSYKSPSLAPVLLSLHATSRTALGTKIGDDTIPWVLASLQNLAGPRTWSLAPPRRNKLSIAFDLWASPCLSKIAPAPKRWCPRASALIFGRPFSRSFGATKRDRCKGNTMDLVSC